MANITSFNDVTDISPNLGGRIVKLDFTKSNSGDVVIVPEYYGQNVVWCNVVDKSDMTPDDPAAVSGREVTLSTGTGDRVGLFLVE